MSRKYRTIIADDEQPARERLKTLLEAYPDKIELIGEAHDGFQCRDMINSLNPDLIFLDIQMPGINGFELVRHLLTPPVIIFCTAFDEYALQAFETNSIDYIVKPVRKERIQKSIEKLDKLRQNPDKTDLVELMESFIQKSKKFEITTIPVKLGDRMLFIKIDDVSYFSSDEKYTMIYTIEGKKYLCDYSLKNLENKLSEKFIRIHRSLLINKARIREISRYSGTRYMVFMNDKSSSRLISGRNYAEEIKEILKL